MARELSGQVSRVARTGLREQLNEAIAAAVLGGIPSDEIGRIFQEALARFAERRRS